MKTQSECMSVIRPSFGQGSDSERPEINLVGTSTDGTEDEQTINLGYTPVVLNKLFGPTIFASLRIRPALETCEWVIERQNCATNEWTEVGRVPGQLAEEFLNED